MFGRKLQGGEVVQWVYAVYDKLAEEAGPVFCAVNDAVASRAYRALLQGEKVAYPDEYELHVLGQYDAKKMKMTPLPEPIRVEVLQPNIEVPK